MLCHICQRPAVDRCYNCGELFCENHGKLNCVHCETGIRPGDNRQDRISRGRIANQARPGWWRPQQAEDYEPSECYECQGLAPYGCVQCGGRYCREHAGKNGMCAECQRLARGGKLFVVILIVFLAALTILGIFQSYWK